MRVPWNRGGIRTWLFGASLLAGHATYASVGCGTPLVLAGVGLHFWSKGCLCRNLEVTTVGPYRFVRHPFYLANGLIDAGIVLMSGWWPLLALFPFWWLAVYLPTIRREETYLLGRFGPAYENYLARVSAILPLSRPYPRPKNRRSWQFQNVLRENEIPRAIRLLSSPLPFMLLIELDQHGIASLSTHAGMIAAIVLAWAAFYLAARIVKTILEHACPCEPGCR